MRKVNSVLVALLLAALFCCSEQQKDLLPHKLLDLALTRRIDGAEAIAFINKLHFQEVAADSNEIAFYEGVSGNAIIYLSHYDKHQTARREWLKMTEKISPENSVFINGEIIEYDGLKAYRCFGMGQVHYVFAINAHLIWISVKTVIGEAFLEAYLDAIQEVV